MAKKKKTSSSWLKREISKKFYYGYILFTLFFCVVVSFVYSIPEIGIPISSNIDIYFQNIFSNQANPSVTSHTIAPIAINPNSSNHLWIGCGQLLSGCNAYHQHVSPTPSPIVQLPDNNFNKLIIYRTRYTHEDTAFFTKVIMDQSTIKRLYNDIKSSDFWKPGEYHCPMDNGIEYVLNFYAHDILTVHSVLNVTGCRGIRFTKYTGRRASSKLIDDIQQALELSNQEFYGY